MAENTNTHEVVVAHASFWFTDVGGRNRIATRGKLIEVNDEDFERGEKHGAFAASPADLHRLGELPSLVHLYEDGDLDPDEDDLEEISAWMRSASLEDVQSAVAEAAASGVDITSLLAAGELHRGSEARADVLGSLVIALAESEKVADPEPAPLQDPDPAPAPDPAPDEPASDRIDDITEWVGTDVDRATARLAIEQEKGDDARPTLVKALEEIITAPPAGDS